MTTVATRDNLAVVVGTIQSDDFKAKLAQALPEGVTVDRFVRTASTAIQMNPDLVAGSGTKLIGSLYNAVVRCAQDGLLPDNREAALVKFKSKGEDLVQYLPMIGGLRKVAAKNRITLTAFVVYENDDFDYELGFDPTVQHKPPKLSEERGEPIGAYAVATDQHGRKYLEVMGREEIERTRKVSRAATSEYGPWVNWWGEMARKTVARRLFKQLPLGEMDDLSRRVLAQVDADTVYVPDEALADLPRGDGDPETGWEPVEPDIVVDPNGHDEPPPPDDSDAPVGEQPSFEEMAQKAQQRKARTKATE